SPGAAGALPQPDRRAAPWTEVHCGFDRERLFGGGDGAHRIVDVLAGGRDLSLKFVAPAGVRFTARQVLGRLVGTFWDRRTTLAGMTNGPLWVERGPGGAAVAAGSVLELALPLADLSVAAGQPLAFFVALYESDSGTELERHPE